MYLGHSFSFIINVPASFAVLRQIDMITEQGNDKPTISDNLGKSIFYAPFPVKVPII